jgi:aminoglycoside phosphotransferase (APT) family kinase protein
VPFAILEFCPGTTIQTLDQLDELSDEVVIEICTETVQVLAALHRVDPEKVGLGNLGRSSGYAERQTKRWSTQWDLVGDPALQGLATRAADLLRRAVPEQGSTSIVHGDYRIDNTLVLIEDIPRITAVVDWELSTLGDPVADVAMMCAYRNPAFDLVLGMPTAWASPRLPSVEQLASRYESAGGVPLTNWEFYFGLAHFKIAVIAAGIAHRHHLGGTDEAFAAAADAVEPYLAAAVTHLETIA